MNGHSLLYPLLAQVTLTFGVALWYVVLRFQAVSSGELPASYFLLNRGARPPRRLELVGHNYDNLLELPILFYVAVLVIVVTGRGDPLYEVLAWLFVATRVLHTAIHTTSNHLRRRAGIFLFGAFLLMLLWLRIGGQLLVVRQ